jgi:hypothetical protein
MAEGPRKDQGPLLAVLLLTMVMSRRTRGEGQRGRRRVGGSGGEEEEEGGRRRRGRGG